MKCLSLLFAVAVLYGCGGEEAVGKTPDLLTMLQTIKGGGEVSKVLGFINEMKLAREGLSTVEKISPLMKSIYAKAAKRNPKLEILLRVIDGHVPDLHDIYRLLTTKSDSMGTDIANEKMKSPLYRELNELLRNESLHPTQEGMTQLAQIFLGHGFQFNQDLFHKATKEGKDVELTGDEIAEFNILELLLSYADNYNLIYTIGKILIKQDDDQGSTITDKLLQAFTQLDLAHFQKVQALPDTLNNGKYQVGKHGHSQQDPDVTQLLQDQASVGTLRLGDSKDESKAEALLVDVSTRLLRVVVNNVNQAALVNSKDTTTHPDVNVFG